MPLRSAPALDQSSPFRAIFDHAAIGISVVDDDGMLVDMNPAFLAFLGGYTREELIGRASASLSPAEDAHITREAVRILRAGERESVTVEKRFARRDGTLRIASLTLSRLPFGNGEFGIVAVTGDVTEQHSMQRALRENEARHRELLDTLPLVVYLVEPTFPYAPIFISQGVASFGFTHAEWTSAPDNWANALHPDDRDRVLRMTNAAFESGGAVEYEYRLIAKDGSLRWVHDRGEFILGSDGVPIAWRGIMLDLTGRREAEAALANERGFLAAILDSLSEGIVACDRFGKVTLFNRATRELHGLPAEGFIPPEQWGPHYNSYRAESHPEAGSPMPADELPLVQALRSRGAVHGVEFQIAPAGRVPRTVVSNAHVIRGSNGEFLGAVSASRDMTDQKAVEKALRASEARVRGAVQASLDAMFIGDSIRDAAGDIMDFALVGINARAAALVNRPEADLLGRSASHVFPLLRTAGLLAAFCRVVETGIPFEQEIQPLDERIAADWVRLQCVRVGDGIGVTARDISDQKVAEATLRALALVDELTGVHNRRGFLALAEREWQRAQRERRGAVLAYIDLDDFKVVNDLHGHAEGDAALRGVADVLRAAFRGADVIGRMGGDEFAVLVVPTGPALATSSEIFDIERRIVERLHYHLDSSNLSARAQGREYDIGMSIGTAVVALVGDTGTDSISLSSLMVLADERLYEQKRARLREVVPA